MFTYLKESLYVRITFYSNEANNCKNEYLSKNFDSEFKTEDVNCGQYNKSCCKNRSMMDKRGNHTCSLYFFLLH